MSWKQLWRNAMGLWTVGNGLQHKKYTNKVVFFKSFVEAHIVRVKSISVWQSEAYLDKSFFTFVRALWPWQSILPHTHTHRHLLNVWVSGCLIHNSPLSDNSKCTCAVDKEHSVKPGTSSSFFNYICVWLFFLLTVWVCISFSTYQ